MYALTPLDKPVTAAVTVPGSKSYTNRALLLAALVPHPVTILHPLISDDTQAMLGCLQRLGIAVQTTATSFEVTGSIADVKPGDYELNANLSGTTIRFMLALACLVPGTVTLHGKGHLNERPIGELVEALRSLGANIDYLGRIGYPPLKINPSSMRPGFVQLSGSLSSIFVSAILMIAPQIGAVTISITEDLVSKPYVDMTLEVMRRFGVTVAHDGYNRFHIDTGKHYECPSYEVEGDISSACYFFAVAALTKSSVTVRNLNEHSGQADMQLLRELEAMGNEVKLGKGHITVNGKGITPAIINVENFPDQAPTLAVLAAFAHGTTTLNGIHSLRIKESDRVAALETELGRMGIKTQSTDDTLSIHGAQPLAAHIDTHGDHRMAMAFAVAGAILPGLTIGHPEVVSKTFPGFWPALRSVGVGVKTNIALIGMRGSGKTTVGKIIAEQLGRPFFDLDAVVEQRLGTTIADLVKQHGWDYFRKQESKLIEEFTAKTDIVFATGGGAITVPQNTSLLKQSCYIVLLTASVAILTARIQGDPDRPPLTHESNLKDELTQLDHDRSALYKAAADLTIASSHDAPQKIAKHIMEQYS